jgi:aspartate kinase
VALIVQKYGGTSVGSTERIRRVADRCLRTQAEGHDVVVVVSAMSGETNRLLELVRAISDAPSMREQDAVVSTGEQVSVGLLALAIQRLGGKARSFTGQQVRILTDSVHGKARIKEIDGSVIRASLAQKEIVVVAGFQGVDASGDITTLGRGGSDTSAVAIAAALGADACEIYTDVEGVYTTDPNLVKEARRLERISYEEMMELASQGAKVLQIRAVEAAMKYRVPLWVKSSFTDGSGTLVCEEDKAMEDVLVSGIAFDRNEAKITVRDVPDKPGMAAMLFGALDEKQISVDLIVQNLSRKGMTDLTFTVTQGDLKVAEASIRRVAEEIGAGEVESDEDVSKVSIVGVGMRNHSGVAARMFQVLGAEGINVQMISTSEIKVSCVVRSEHTDRAVKALHAAFGLDREADTRA